MADTTVYEDGDTFELDGRTFKVTFEHDSDCGMPWDACGNGPVSEWEYRDKRPGEWILSAEGRRGELRCFYNAQEAQAIALRDAWGISEEDRAALLERLSRPRKVRRVRKGEKPTVRQSGFISRRYEYRADQCETVTIPGRDPAKPLTRREIAAEAVRRNYEYLRGWCKGDWHYMIVGVEHVESGETQYLGGVESLDMADASQHARELAREIAQGLPNVPDGFDYVECSILTHFVAALINCDVSGLTAREAAELLAWERGVKAGRREDGHWSCESGNETNFATCEVTACKGDCATVRYVFRMESEE